ncbi:MAG TPA: hypothetical protein VFQ24_18505 [Terriglobia bacterium]|nr:hypothetical protein [Terriglobia bacterium]
MKPLVRAIRWPEETVPVRNLDCEVPLIFSSLGIEFGPFVADTSEPRFIIQRAAFATAWAGEILSSTNSGEKEAWQDGNIRYFPCA